MERSLFSAQVQFLDDHLALIHIPLELYSFYIQPVLQLLFLDVPPIEGQLANCLEVPTSSLPGFFNVSITPVECSVICSRTLADRYFGPLLDIQHNITAEGTPRVEISSEDFIVMQVEGQGLDAGRRVLELTSPLAMAGVSIFFISTYFSDYILFPRRFKSQVIRALECRGFNFESSSDTFSAQPPYPSPTAEHPSPPRTPPPSSLSELQSRTFSSLRRHDVHPHVDKTLQILQCAVHYKELAEAASFASLRPSLVTTLLLDKPRFLSVTVTATDPSASILLEKRLLPRFSSDERGDNILLGSLDDVLIPIILDLRNLPLEATGIVCGVAGRMATGSCSVWADHVINDEDQDSSEHLDLLFETAGRMTGRQSMNQPMDSQSIEMSFLSTARTGTVIVREEELTSAMASLEVEKEKPDPLSEVMFRMNL